jgi:hypothetical protein
MDNLRSIPDRDSKENFSLLPSFKTSSGAHPAS